MRSKGIIRGDNRVKYSQNMKRAGCDRWRERLMKRVVKEDSLRRFPRTQVMTFCHRRRIIPVMFCLR